MLNYSAVLRNRPCSAKNITAHVWIEICTIKTDHGRCRVSVGFARPFAAFSKNHFRLAILLWRDLPDGDRPQCPNTRSPSARTRPQSNRLTAPAEKAIAHLHRFVPGDVRAAIVDYVSNEISPSPQATSRRPVRRKIQRSHSATPIVIDVEALIHLKSALRWIGLFAACAAPREA